MKFILNKDTLKIENEDRINAGAVNYYEADVEYDESWDELTIECVIVKKNNEVGNSVAVINNKMFIDQELNGLYSIGFVGYTIEDNKKIYQISTNLKTLHFYKGAGEIKTENAELPTPTEWEVYIAQIQEMIDNIDVNGGGNGGISEEKDPTVPQHVKEIAKEDIEKWNNGSNVDLSGLATKEEVKAKASIEDMTNYIEGHKEELKGADGKDGYTPVKGVDYFDGKDGTKGETGPQGPQGDTGPQGPTGKDGTNGKDGISVTHSWNGTTLTVTSASGTTSTDLKGDKGDKGEQGVNGQNGIDGYTPVKGTDYWTEEDQTVIKDDAHAYIVEELAKRGQLKPEFANTVEECTDTTKLYVLPDGYIYGYIYTNVEVGGYTNQIDTTSSDFKSGSRFNASGDVATVSTTGAFVSNMFACKPGDVLRIKGVTGATTGTTAANFTVGRYKDDGSKATSGNNIAYLKENASLSSNAVQQCWNAYTTEADGTIIWTFAMNNGGTNFASAVDGVVNARIAGIATNGIENVIVTVNEEIKEPTIVREYQWTNTGHAFVPADYEDRIIAIENSIDTLKEDIKNEIQEETTTETTTSSVNWYAFGDSITQGYVSYLKEDGTASSKLVPSAKQSWVYKVAELNGYNVTNYAVGGTGYAYGNPNVTTTAREQVDAVDFTNCDLVTLAWGCNDWKYNGGAVGTADDDKDIGTTPCASLKYVIEKIQSQNPLCKIIVLTPINVCFWGTFEGNYGLSYSFSKTGTLEEFYNAIVSVCKYYGVEYIDNTHSSIFNRVNITSLLLDGVHPTPEAYVVMAKELAKKINFK